MSTAGEDEDVDGAGEDADRADLVRRAQARGVAVSYRDWRGREVKVSPETLAAILAVLGDPGTPPPDQDNQRPAERPGDGPSAPAEGAFGNLKAPQPQGRSWGFTVQLYALRSRGSWGHGDLRDLADLAAWSGRGLGAGFVLCSPLHAAEPLPPVTASPYMPMSRQFTSPLYLRIEDIPEYGRLDPAAKEQIAALAGPLRARNTTADLIDRDAVWAAKRAALELLWDFPASPQRQAEFERFRERRGEALDGWASWCALAEIHGPDWRDWPAELRDPRSDAVAAERARLAGPAGFHAWLQFLADEQRAAVRRAASDAGMRVGVIHDLAVGAHPGGADAWANRDVIAHGVSVGAPPDEFNQLGQDWALPPWHPERLAADGYRPLAGLIDATLGNAGGIRADHVMGLLRLWWVPAGMTPDRGTYVSYDHEAMVGVLASAAARAGAIAVGEDLGTIDPWIRGYLSDQGILGTSILWFERSADGKPLPPEDWRPDCLATVGTHDVPPAAAFVTGEQVALRASLGLLSRTEDAERAEADAAITAWRTALTEHGLLPADGRASPEEFTVALYAYLARGRAALIGVSLAEAVGQRAPENMPGTSDQYPNWRIPLSGADGKPVLAEELATHPLVLATARAAGAGTGPAGAGSAGGGSAGRGSAGAGPAGVTRPGGPAPGTEGRAPGRPGSR